MRSTSSGATADSGRRPTMYTSPTGSRVKATPFKLAASFTDEDVTTLYDAYVNAAFHGSMTRIEAALDPSITGTEEETETLPPVQLDVPRRTRVLAYAVTATLCELVAVLGSI